MSEGERRRFGAFEFNLRTLELRGGGTPVRLPPQPSRLLAVLLERPGELVTREEIQRRLWPDTVVEFDHGINTCVRQIRDALGEAAGAPAFLQTVPRRGYRFVIPTEPIARESERRPRPWVRVALVVGVLGGVAAVTARVNPPRRAAAAEPAPAAREAYFKARHLLAQGRSDAVGLFREALQSDSTFGPAIAGLARAQFQNGHRDSAEATARRALAVDSSSVEAHLVLADIRAVRDWDWRAAERHLEQALAAAPEKAEVHHARAFLLSVRGRHAEARAAMGQALALDPVSPLVRGDAGWLDLWARRYDHAVRRCEETLQLDSSAVGADLCLLYANALRGRPADAVRHAARVMTARGQPRESGRLAAMSDPDDALREYWRLSLALLDTVPSDRVDPYTAAVVRAMAGDPAAALDWLERAAESRSMLTLAMAVDPRLDALRRTPRYRQLISRMRLGAVGAGAQDERAVAITIDDLPATSAGSLGELATITDALLAALAGAGAPAVGFVVGSALDVRGEETARRSLLARWLDAGHELGNHTYAHRSANRVSPDEYARDVARGEAALSPLVEARGGRVRYFRHPQLHTGADTATRDAVRASLAERGYTVAPVTLDNQEWVYARAYERRLAAADTAEARRVGLAYLTHLDDAFTYYESLSQRVFGRAIPQVLLLHANRLNADHLAALLGRLRERGYRFATLDEALRDSAYREADPYVGPRGLSWLQRWAMGRGITPPAEPRESPEIARLAGLDERGSQP